MKISSWNTPNLQKTEGKKKKYYQVVGRHTTKCPFATEPSLTNWTDLTLVERFFAFISSLRWPILARLWEIAFHMSTFYKRICLATPINFSEQHWQLTVYSVYWFCNECNNNDNRPHPQGFELAPWVELPARLAIRTRLSFYKRLWSQIRPKIWQRGWHDEKDVLLAVGILALPFDLTLCRPNRTTNRICNL